MKKTLMVFGLCAILVSMPALCALPANQKTLPFPPMPDYDGTFIGGIGTLYKENGEWQFDYYAYLAGAYKNMASYHKLYGYIYNLDEEQVGYIGAFFGYKIIIGYIEDMENHRAPIIGFLLWNDTNFAGRIMSVFGPAPHIIGEYTPNT